MGKLNINYGIGCVYFPLGRCDICAIKCWELARFSQPIIGLAEPIDDQLHHIRFVGRHSENLRTWTVGRGNDISHHSIRDLDLSSIAMICSNIFYAKQGIS